MSAGQHQDSPPVVRSEVNGRENQEDSFLTCSFWPSPVGDPIHLLAVADGMGGHQMGEAFSREVLRRLAQGLFERLVIQPRLNQLSEPAPTLGHDAMAQALLDVVPVVNAFIRKMLEANHIDKAGSTLVAALVQGPDAVLINVGDSPAYLRPAKGAASLLTQSHGLADMLCRAGVLSSEAAKRHPTRHVLQHYMGAELLPDPLPVVRLDLSLGDVLLLCSDGVSGPLQLGTLDAMLGPQADLGAVGTRLLQMAREAGETDNQTLVLWRYEPKAAAAPASPPPMKTRLVGPKPKQNKPRKKK